MGLATAVISDEQGLPKMSRRSFRLMSSGYYNSDEESDSSSVTNISYRENPVKVFKKKARASKGPSKSPTTFKSNGLSGSSSASTSKIQPSPPKGQPGRGIPAAPSVSADVPTPDRSHHARWGGGRSTMDSSGYSSSEDPNRKPLPSATSNASKSYGRILTEYRPRINSVLFSLMDSISPLANPIHNIVNVAARAKTPLSSHVRKAFALFLLLLFISLCVFWFLLSPFTSILLNHNKDVAHEFSQANPEREFASHEMDPAIVNTAVEEKMRQVVEKLQLTQEEFLLQLRESVHFDMENMKARLENVDLKNRLYLEREHAVLDKQLSDFHSDSASLKLRIQDVETKNTKLSEEWASFKRKPPAAWCPCVSTDSGQTHLSPQLQTALKRWFSEHFRVEGGVMKEQDTLRLIEKGSCSECVYPIADKMPDFALETQGASVVSTRCSETYRVRSACVTLFGFPLWYPSESPRTVIQGSPVLLPGKCWAFHGAQGSLVISLSHPITITHVTLDHLPRYKSPTGHINSSPKDFEVHGMKNEMEDGTLLGTFTYDEYGEPTQTFELPLQQPNDEVYRFVELRVLSNWGHMEYTCLYRFRVHGHISN